MTWQVKDAFFSEYEVKDFKYAEEMLEACIERWLFIRNANEFLPNNLYV